MDPVGSRKTLQVDVRVISATNRRLKDMVETGEFREDLFYRLNIFPIHLPPLRDRKGDFEHLVPQLIENITRSEGYPIIEISPDAMALLKSYHWPGNIRQLENALFSAIILSEGGVITPADFPQIHSNLVPLAALPGQKGGQKNLADPDSQSKHTLLMEYTLSGLDESGDIRPLQDVERDMIRFALKKYNGRMSEIARRLGLGRSTLYRKVTELNLEGEDSPKKSLAE